MGTWTIQSSFVIQVGTVTGVAITVDYLAGKEGAQGAQGAQGIQGIQGNQGIPGNNAPTIHSGLTLDDGTNPHGTTKEDVGLSNVPNLSFSGTNTGDQDLSGKENTSNKSNDVLDIASTTKFPVWKVITDWVIGSFATIANLALKANIASPTFTGVVTLPVGTLNRIPKYTSTGVLGDSVITELPNGNIGVANPNSESKLDVGIPRGSYKLTLSPISNFYGADVSAGQVGLYSNAIAAVDKGGSFSFGGENTVGAGANTPYIFAQIKGANEGATSTYNGYLAFRTTNTNSSITEKARITSNGNLLVATTVDNTIDKLQVNGSIQTNNLLKVGQYTTATEPAYVKGAQFFNTTLNKMRIGGATVWETVTSS